MNTRPNIIVVMLDSFRQDHVSAYGWDNCPLKTPSLDALAAQAVMFDNVYPENLPTIPVRTDLFTGQSSLTNRPWQALSATDVTLTQILRKAGYFTAMVADTYHYFKPDMNFHRAMDVFHWIRGAEYDGCGTGPLRQFRLEDHVTPGMNKGWHMNVLAALRNLEGRSEPEDFLCYQTMSKSLEVLDQSRRQDKPAFLWIDTFQPHEPWCPPAKFDTFGDCNYRGPKIVLPPGGAADKWGTVEQIRRTQSLYAGEMAYVDWCLGTFFDGLKQMGYFENSIVVVLSDHGHPLADHGKFLKGPDRMYNELLKVPFIVRLPGGQYGGRRSSALGRFPDLAPTLLDLAGLGGDTPGMAGRSLRGPIEGKGTSPYAATISGFFGGIDRCIRNEQYSYVVRPQGQSDEFYDLQADCHERTNLIDQRRDAAEALSSQFGPSYFNQYRPYRGVQGSSEVQHTSLE
ncbi:MAG: sulfatase [Planctomycetaceae bacterium]|nr:sulfatase [Planctomycetaceae bacterium]